MHFYVNWWVILWLMKMAEIYLTIFLFSVMIEEHVCIMGTCSLIVKCSDYQITKHPGFTNDVCAQVYLKNLPPSSTLIDEIMDNVKSFLVSKALLKGDPSKTSHSLRHLPGESVSLFLFLAHSFISFYCNLFACLVVLKFLF